MSDIVNKRKIIVTHTVFTIILAITAMVWGAVYIFRPEPVADITQINITADSNAVQEKDFNISVTLSGKNIDKINDNYVSIFVLNDNIKSEYLRLGDNTVQFDDIGEHQVKALLIDGNNRLHIASKTIQVFETAIPEGIPDENLQKDDVPPEVSLLNKNRLQYCKLGFGLFLDIEISDNVSKSGDVALMIQAYNGSINYDNDDNVYFLSQNAGEATVEITAKDQAQNSVTIRHKLIVIDNAMQNDVVAHYDKWVGTAPADNNLIIFGHDYFNFTGTLYNGVEFVSDILYKTSPWELELIVDAKEILTESFIGIDIRNYYIKIHTNGKVSVYKNDGTILTDLSQIFTNTIKIKMDGQFVSVSVDNQDFVLLGDNVFTIDYLSLDFAYISASIKINVI